jgi:hypothetical protein
MNEKHPLFEKQLIKLPCNWTEWLERWKAEDDPMALLSLLHHGPEMPAAGKAEYEAEAEATILYLRLAKEYYHKEQQFGEETGFDQKDNIFTCPRYTLGKTAFQTLCKHGFQKTESNKEPWEYFLWNDRVLGELLVFLGTDSCFENGTGGDELHGLFCYAKERYQEILKTFCLGLAEFLIEMPFPTHTGEETKVHQIAIWRSHRHAAIKILWYLDRLDLLIEHKKMVDESLLGPLEKFILARDIEIPISTRSTKTVCRKPREVRDVLKIKADSYFWHHGGCEITKAAYVYLGLIGDRN